ncbi:MAG: helix-turn-helix transcriptional regulator [Acidaminococcaceae bacterium]|nr:helix-turn-helix transcriptional regulator [Acidaminococcaceae bacterium]
MKSKVVAGRFPEFKERLNLLALKYESTTEFAAALGISRQTVGFWLNGNRAPDADSLITISEKMDVSVDWLLGLSAVRNFSKDPGLREICEYTQLTPYAVEALHSHFSSGEFFSYLIANASRTDIKSFLYYIAKADMVSNHHSHFGAYHSEAKEDKGHIEYIRDKKDNSFGIKLNDKESVMYLTEKGKYILSLLVENYVMSKWEGKTPDYLIDRFKLGLRSVREDGEWEYELSDDGKWEEQKVGKGFADIPDNKNGDDK